MESLLINERYRLDTKIGEGGMGVVYRAHDTLLDTTVAVKALKSDLQGSQRTHLERFLREGRALHKLNHPNIVRLLDMVEYQSQHYLIMDYIDGGNLGTLLSDNPLPAKRVLEIGLDLADALTRAHRLNIIHRDLKPANVLIAPDGTPRLTDFGVALIGSMERVTGEHILVGTIDYMSPETLQSASSDTKTDIWSFGILMYEMLTGERPFTDSSPGIVVSNIIFGKVPDLETLCPHAPIALIDLIYRMLDKDPNTRISSMRLVGVELDALLNNTKTGDTLPHTASSERSKSTFDPLTPSKPMLSNLPTRTTQFLGRETELLEINQLISERKTRQITFLAPGGMGKSRFALEIAYQQQSSFKDGVYFLELTAFDKDSNMITLIATALNFVLKVEGDEQKQQLLHYLSERELLIVFDNFDDLLNFAPLITEILEASPRTMVLVTSRRRLNLAIETVYNLGGMATPDWQDPLAAMQSGIVQLFLQGAKRAQARFELHEADLPHLARICDGVQGMPLGILLASSWVEMLSLSEIALEVSKNLDFLETDISDIPERQRSIRAVFDYSWNLLTEEEQSVFLKLSVCRGGFTRMAAQSLTDAKLSVLMSLMNKSLIQRNADTGRYAIHELLRQYAAKKLRDSGGEVAALDAHSQYYANAIAKRYPALCGKEQVTAIQDIDSDFENVYQAWLHTLHRQHYDTAYQILFPLTRYCTLRNRYNEQNDLLQLAIDAIAHQPVLHVFQPILKALVGANQSLRDIDYFKQCLKEVPIDNKAGLAFCHQALGIVYKLNGLNQLAVEHHQQALREYQSLNMIFEQANVLLHMSDCYLEMGDGERTVALIEDCLVLRNAIGDLRGQGAVMMQLGSVHLVRGNYDKVEEYWHQVLDIVEQVSGHRNAAPETATALALVYFLRGEVERSLVLALEMVEVSKAYSLIDYEGFALAIVACCKVLQNDVASAVQYIQRMDALKSADFDYWIESDKHWARTLVSVASGDWEKAKRSCIEAMKAGLLSDGTLMIWSLPLSAMIIAQQDNHEQATESISLSLTHPTAAQGWLQRWELFNNQVQVLKDKLEDRFDKAWLRGQAADLQAIVRERISLLSELP